MWSGNKNETEYVSVSDVTRKEDEIYEKVKPHEHEQPRLLRGHPRWCPTNNPNDINCLYFAVPIPRRALVKQQYNWMNQRNDLNKTEDRLRLRQELLYSGSMTDCLKLKYLKRKDDAIKIISQRYGSDEPYNTENYKKNHLFDESQFRDRPPKYFDNPKIPTQRYIDLKQFANVGLPYMEYESIQYHKTKWGTSYKLFKLRSFVKNYLISKDILEPQNVDNESPTIDSMFPAASVAVVLLSSVALGDIECGSNSVSIDWSVSSTTSSVNRSSYWESGYNTTQCSQSACGAYSYDVERKLTAAAFPNFERTQSFSVDSAFCGRDRLCNYFAGGLDQCYAVNYDYQLWYPRSCDNGTDYNAIYVDYNITYKYACCNSTKCNENYDFGLCQFNQDLGNYVSELYGCWNDVKRDFMKYLVCDDSGNRIYSFEGNCFENGVWINRGSGDYNCTYTLTCSNVIQRILQNFGDCACEAATSNNYPGYLIAEVMETQWNTYCPNINLTCAANGDLELYRRRWFVRWRLRLAMRRSLFSSVVRRKIRRAIARAANCDESNVNITLNDTDTDTDVTRRRLLYESTIEIEISIETNSENDATTVLDNLNTYGLEYVSDQGYNATNATGSVDSEYEDISDSDSGTSYVSTTENGSSGNGESGAAFSISCLVPIVVNCIIGFIVIMH